MIVRMSKRTFGLTKLFDLVCALAEVEHAFE